MEDLYDEFGNYIGEAESDIEDDDDDNNNNDNTNSRNEHDSNIDHGVNGKVDENDVLVVVNGDERPSNSVVLHEDKQYYPTAQQVYGEDVETLVEEEDSQPLSQPIIAPIVEKKFTIEERDLPKVNFSREFLEDLMGYPDHVRNIVFAGDLHHGKTSLVDMLVLETHDLQEKLDKRTSKRKYEQLRYTDTHVLERQRGLSIKTSALSLILGNSRGKSYVFNLLDSPGHVNFSDEVAVSLRLADGLVLVVDVVEGVLTSSELAIKHALLAGLSIVLIINKMDRLILELKLPPADAYFRLKLVVEEVNDVIARTAPVSECEKLRLSPEKGNVAFACSTLEWCFTLSSFAKRYIQKYGNDGGAIEEHQFAQRLWGDIFFNGKSRKFTRKPIEAQAKRSFVTFILEPIYKIFSHTISGSPSNLPKILKDINVTLKPWELKMNAKELLKIVCKEFFGKPSGFVDMIVEHVKSPQQAGIGYREKFFTGPSDGIMAKSIDSCDKDGPLILHVTKLFHSGDATLFHALCRVLSGRVRRGQVVRILGEGFTIDDPEDMMISEIKDVWIPCSRYNVPTFNGVPAGNIALLGGVENSIVKSCTIVGLDINGHDSEVPQIVNDLYIFRPIKHFYESVFKVAVEPINPSELPKMLEGLRKIGKVYPLSISKVEESGEHIILGTGELYMDCILHDLRKLYSEIEIKVSDPVTRFCETVIETSSIKCYSNTPNKKNKVTMVAEALDEEIAQDIENEVVSIRDPVRVVGKFFQEKYDYDLLASRNIWAFGPNERGPNLLQNDTLPSEVLDKQAIFSVRESIRQGFTWATKEGPLCEEPMRNVKFRITDLTISPEPIYRGGGQLIPTTRRACHSSFLLASPRLMEPIYSCRMIGSADAITSLYTVIARRRGHVLQDGPIPGTPLYQATGLIPVIDSFGFETDLKIHSKSQAAISLVFHSWSIVPGDPLDRNPLLRARPLNPAPIPGTARDFVLKTRRRKGLTEDISIARFLEPELTAKLRETGILDT